MGGLARSSTFVFAGFQLDRRGLFRHDERGVLTPVPLGGRALDLLGLLVERHGEVVSKAEIMDAVWPNMVVEDGNLTLQISTLRRVLDQGRAEGSCIQTVARRGYRFVFPLDRPATPVREARSKAYGVAAVIVVACLGGLGWALSRGRLPRSAAPPRTPRGTAPSFPPRSSRGRGRR